MIIFPVKIKILLIGQLWNTVRISAGFDAIRSIREERIHDFPLKHLLRRRKGTLHLIVDDTIVGQIRIRRFELIAPALLTENCFLFINIRIKYRVQIDMHQVAEIGIVAARKRIHRLIRIGHCIQKCIQGALYQFHERILRRKLPAAAQNRVLYDMRHSRTVCRRRAKGDIEHLIFIVIFQHEHTCMCLSVLQKIAFGMDIRQCFLPDQTVLRYFFQIHLSSSVFLIYSCYFLLFFRFAARQYPPMHKALPASTQIRIAKAQCRKKASGKIRITGSVAGSKSQ